MEQIVISYKRWIIIAILLFGIGLAGGLATPDDFAALLSEDLIAFEGLGSLLAPFNILTAIIILAKNVSALLISFILSPVLCLMPILTLTVNGWLIALVSSIVVEEKSVGFLLAGLAPHGIVELPAFIMGEAAALSFGTAAMVALFNKERRNQLLPNLKQNTRYLLIALALLIPAAIIETYITPLLLT